jgi:hypothetical protein
VYSANVMHKKKENVKLLLCARKQWVEDSQDRKKRATIRRAFQQPQ